MEEEYVRTPQRWSHKGLPLFMLWNGPVCSIFDTTTFIFLWFYYDVDKPSQSRFFQSAWFVEGLLMQTLIIHLIRTEKIPFIQDVASWPVLCSTFVISAIGIAIPFTPIGRVMGLTNLPLSYFGFLVVLIIAYFFLGQVVKRAYILVYKKWLWESLIRQGSHHGSEPLGVLYYTMELNWIWANVTSLQDVFLTFYFVLFPSVDFVKLPFNFLNDKRAYLVSCLYFSTSYTTWYN